MVGAADEPLVGPFSGLEELVTAVAAHIVEGAQGSILISGEKGRLEAERHRALISRGSQILCAADANPAPVEEVLELPPEHPLVCVGFRGERAALAEGSQGRSERFRGNRYHGGHSLRIAVSYHIY